MSALVSALRSLSLGFRFVPPSFSTGRDINAAVRRDMARDYQAMAGDWYRTGADLRGAMHQHYVQLSDADQKRLLEILDNEATKKTTRPRRRAR